MRKNDRMMMKLSWNQNKNKSSKKSSKMAVIQIQILLRLVSKNPISALKNYRR